jgi:hypothetical protein
VRPRAGPHAGRAALSLAIQVEVRGRAAAVALEAAERYWPGHPDGPVLLRVREALARLQDAHAARLTVPQTRVLADALQFAGLRTSDPDMQRLENRLRGIIALDVQDVELRLSAGVTPIPGHRTA